MIITIPWSSLCPDNQRAMPIRMGAKGVRVMTSQKYRKSKDAIGAEALAVVSRIPHFDDDASLELRATFWLPNARRTDVTNYAKGLLDALIGIVYRDDWQVVSSTWERAGIDRKNPRVILHLWEQE